MGHEKTSGPTLVVLLLICLGMAFFGMRALTADLPASPISTSTEPYCLDRQVTAGSRVFPQDVMVSVYNAGSEAGVASQTMAELVERGFARGETGNVEADVRVVQVWAEDRHNPAVQLVARQFGPRTRVVTTDQLVGQGVMVVVGDDFERLRRKKVRSVTARSDATICAPPLDAPVG